MCSGTVVAATTSYPDCKLSYFDYEVPQSVVNIIALIISTLWSVNCSIRLPP